MQTPDNLKHMTDKQGMRDPANRPRTHASSSFAYVGCYTTPGRDGHGEGINVYRIDQKSGIWRHVQVVKGLTNPSFLTLDCRGRHLYAVHGDTSQASAFAIEQLTGELVLLNQQSIAGKNPVHLVVDPTDRLLLVANYSTGTVAVLPINPDGSLAPPTSLTCLGGGPGPSHLQRDDSHPHHVLFDPSGHFILVCDKGLDKIFVYRLNAAGHKLVANDPPFASARPGAGPRHLAFHPHMPYAYVINELDSSITTYRFDAKTGALMPVQAVSTLPPSFTSSNATSEISVSRSGRFVYGSNRGHDSIAIYAIDQATAALASVGWESTKGRTPRFFGCHPSGMLLCVANQDSDTITTFTVSQDTGMLTPTRRVVKTGSPVSIVFRLGVS